MLHEKAGHADDPAGLFQAQQVTASEELCVASRESIRYARELLYRSHDALGESAALLKRVDSLLGRAAIDWPDRVTCLTRERGPGSGRHP